eukprot:UN21473
MVREDRTAWKTSYFQRIERLIEEYPTCFIVSADNVGSKQMQQIRIALRGKGEVLMGKNTMMRKAIRGQLAKYPQLEKLLPLIAGNIGFVFTNEDLCEVRDIILRTRKKLLPKPVLLLPWMCLCQEVTLDKVPRRHLSSKLLPSQPRSQRVP